MSIMLASDVLFIAQLVAVLQWHSVTVLYNEDAENWDPTFLSTLHEKGVTTQLTNWTSWTSDNLTNNTDLCLPPGPESVIVLGQPVFVSTVFKWVANCAKDKDQENKLFQSEWIIAVDEGNRTGLLADARHFENCAVFFNTKQAGDASLWTLRHAQNDSELSFVTSLPSANRLTRSRIFPNQRHGLGGRTLTVVAKTWDFILSVSKVNGHDVYQGFIMDIFRELASSLNFSYVLVSPVDDSWGEELDNGQWDGPIGMLTRKEADMVIGFFTITPERAAVADPTTPYLYEHAAIVFRKSGTRVDKQWMFFIQPFQNVVYAVVAGSMVVMLLLLLLLEKCHQSLTRRRTALSDRVTSFQWAVINFEILLAGLVSRPVQQESQSRASRVLVMTWLLFCVILTSAYSSQLTSSLTAGQQDLPFTSLAELLDQDTYKFGVASGTWTSSLLKNSTVVDYQRFYQKVLEFAKEDPDVLSSDILVHKRKAIHEDYASLQGSILLSSAWSIESCGRLTVLPEKLSTTSFGFYLQKGSPYTRIISKQIGLMVDSGLVTKWKRSALPQNTSCWLEDDHSGRVIGLADTQTAFFVAAFGLGLALIVFGIEKRVHLNSCRSGSIVQ